MLDSLTRVMTAARGGRGSRCGHREPEGRFGRSRHAQSRDNRKHKFELIISQPLFLSHGRKEGSQLSRFVCSLVQE